MKPKTRKQRISRLLKTTGRDNVIQLNSSLSPEVIDSLQKNSRQLQLYLAEAAALIGDKRHRSDFSASEWDKLTDCLQQVLYIHYSLNRKLQSIHDYFTDL